MFETWFLDAAMFEVAIASAAIDDKLESWVRRRISAATEMFAEAGRVVHTPATARTTMIECNMMKVCN